MRVLLLSRWFPYPPDNGAKIRIFNLIKALGSTYELDFVTFRDPSELVSENQLDELGRVCHRITVVPYTTYRPDSLKARLAYFSPVPRFLVAVESAEMKACLAKIAEGSNYDIVIASQVDMVPYGARFPARLRIAEEMQLAEYHDAYIKAESVALRARAALTWWKMSRYVAIMMNHFNGVTVVSPSEEKLLASVINPMANIAVIPNGVDVVLTQGDFGVVEPDSLVYSGALTFDANFDAVAYFLRAIFPIILARRPNVHLYVTGKNDPDIISRLPQSLNVTFTGYLADVRPRIAQSWVNIVPLRIGGGTRLKILESLALGTPVVSTSKGAEGLDLADGVDLLIADEPEVFASQVLRLLDNPALRSQLSSQGRVTVATRYDWREIGHKLIKFIDTLRLGFVAAENSDSYGSYHVI